LFYFDPTIIDWEDYFMNIHISGIFKYALKWCAYDQTVYYLHSLCLNKNACVWDLMFCIGNYFLYIHMVYFHLVKKKQAYCHTLNFALHFSISMFEPKSTCHNMNSAYFLEPYWVCRIFFQNMWISPFGSEERIQRVMSVGHGFESHFHYFYFVFTNFTFLFFLLSLFSIFVQIINEKKRKKIIKSQIVEKEKNLKIKSKSKSKKKKNFRVMVNRNIKRKMIWTLRQINPKRNIFIRS
jgi:hypothetical protein